MVDVFIGGREKYAERRGCMKTERQQMQMETAVIHPQAPDAKKQKNSFLKASCHEIYLLCCVELQKQQHI